jgi:hypothetical protein
MSRENLLMMQLFGGGSSSGWLQVVFLVFLLAVPILSPERIRVVSSYRRAYVFFALSIIVPSAASVLMSTVVAPVGLAGSGVTGIQALQLFNAAGPVLFGLSLIFAMKAVVPGFIPPQTSRRTTSHDEPRSTEGGVSVDGDVAE